MIAHFDLHSGAAGDMILGALIDAGARLDSIKKQLDKIGLPTFELSAETSSSGGLRATRIVIDSEEKGDFSSHRAIAGLLKDSDLDASVKERSLSIVGRLSRAEERVHGLEAGEGRFHELDGLDTIIDVVGVATAMRELGIERTTSSAVATGFGTIDVAHGKLPVPPPAVLEIMRAAAIYSGATEGELLTPTGAAILAEYVDSYGQMQPMTVQHVGYGAGSLERSVPNVVRVTIGEPLVGESLDVTSIVECNIDDMNPELYEYVFERLFDAGADDVWLTPVIGKHGRPSQVLSVLCGLDAQKPVIDVILTETSTIGLRMSRASKLALGRRWIEVDVEGHSVRVKIANRGDRTVNIAPEYSDCVRVAKATGIPVKEIFLRASAAAGGRERS